MYIGCIIKHKLYGIGKIIYYEKDNIDNLDFLVEFIKAQSFFHSGNSSKVKGKKEHL